MSSRVKFSKEGYRRYEHDGGHNLFSADSWAALRVSISELDGIGTRVLALKALTNRHISVMGVL